MTNEKFTERKRIDLDALRQSMTGAQHKKFWRSLNELAETEDFEKLVEQEFPRQASLLGSLKRRDFLKVLGASLALAGLTACVPQGSEKIIPYVKPPEELVPGKSTYYASTLLHDGYARGVLVETTTGRPIKIEGSPKHPASLGASDVFMQAAILELYNPDRAKAVTKAGAASSWADFTAALGGILPGDGAGLRLLTENITSPSLIAQIQALLAAYPAAAWYQYSPVGRSNTLAGAQMAFGQPLEPVYDFTKADVILSLDCDFLFMDPGRLVYSRDFVARRQPISTAGVMSRFYMVEASSTLTGSNADHRLAVKPSQVEAFARAIAAKLGINAGAPAADVPGQDWLEPLAADLQRAGANALVVAGERQPAVVHALAHAMNQALGSIGSTVSMAPAAIANAAGEQTGVQGLRALAQELESGAVDTLVILEGNPVYSAPADLNFGAALQKAANRIYLGMYADETAALATWFVPAAHELEMWGDARAFDGSLSLIQPVIEPLYGGKSPYEVLAALQGQGGATNYDLVRAFWQNAVEAADFERAWRSGLSTGLAPALSAAQAAEAGAASVTGTDFPASPAVQGELEIVFEPDYTVWDGRYAGNSWLQELPKPLTKLSWDNGACISPATAARLGLKNDDLVTLTVRGRSLDAAIFVQPGQPDDVVALSLGYGRQGGSGLLETKMGFNASALRTSESPWFDGLTLAAAGGSYNLVSTQEHWTMDNRELIREASLAEFQEHPNFAQHMEEEQPSLLGEHAYDGYAWGMSINLNSCIGCNACVVACQSENNIPTVGKDQVSRGREMLWLRVDRYFSGKAENPSFAFQPLPCMHCEKAPCEPVCPVEATSHSAEGLNEMTYNRCVGTRYCSNNCPYKVRRFNFFKYIDEESQSLRALRNPDVSVRSRGVMEKCTFCVQRINESRIQAEIEGRPIQDGEVRTACQQACPTNAIVFGNINDANSAVRKLKDTPLNYALLDELGTKPRTTYMAKVRNPNPAIQETV